MALNGTVDAVVQGGIKMYEEVILLSLCTLRLSMLFPRFLILLFLTLNYHLISSPSDSLVTADILAHFGRPPHLLTGSRYLKFEVLRHYRYLSVNSIFSLLPGLLL